MSGPPLSSWAVLTGEDRTEPLALGACEGCMQQRRSRSGRENATFMGDIRVMVTSPSPEGSEPRTT